MLKRFQALSLFVAAIIAAASPCLAAIPDARASCAMAACPGTAGASFDAARACCCERSKQAASVGTGIPFQISTAASSATPDFYAPGPGAGARTIAGLGAEAHLATPVPLYLLHASLLI